MSSAVDRNPPHLSALLTAIHPEGYIFLAISLTVAFLMALASPFMGWIGLIISAWVAYFFRNPKRTTPTRDGLVISPADGIVHRIIKDDPPAELEMPEGDYTRISIFLNVFDVHINRIPMAGRIVRAAYHHGQFFNASFDKASKLNERNGLVVESDDGTQIGFVQIAGLIARRIRCDVNEGDVVETGQTYGLIRFGSRADIFIPSDTAPLVIEGQRMIGGETILADFESKEPARQGTAS
ncbi:MAG: phosphatidylserine decarboxylase [Alphaproteobacteria bacterium]